METRKQSSVFDKRSVLHALKHYLPAQAPLKDFVHHNTLHAFQHLKFDDALRSASEIFGYKVWLSLDTYRELYASKRIRADILEHVISNQKGNANLAEWINKVLNQSYSEPEKPRIGALRAHWKKVYHLDLDSLVHPLLFRILCSYLDQGIAIWSFPIRYESFLDALRRLDGNSFTSFFRTKKVRKFFLSGTYDLSDLLAKVVGDESLYEQYLFDQQFAHAGWSGLVSVIEDQPDTLLDTRKISLHDLIVFELFLELDALESQRKGRWEPLSQLLTTRPIPLFANVVPTEESDVLAIWQQAYEWSYYDQVLAGIELEPQPEQSISNKSFQAYLCIDDRECSLRRYLEQVDPHCETYGTPGFFGVEFYFQPEDGKYYTKVCPVPVTPHYLIKEIEAKNKRHKDLHFNKHAQSFFGGWLISQTLGFWSAIRLFYSIFRPSMSAAAASSLKHMDKFSTLTVENKDPHWHENGLQIGFQISEMAERVEATLRSTGLLANFAPIVYMMGHGASSVNNPHYAAYDCGACSGRAGSVNARVFSYMANHPDVRALLRTKGIDIPDTTWFLGALHDTTRDEMVFFDEDSLLPSLIEQHQRNKVTIERALDLNAKERSRRFDSIDSHLAPQVIHNKIRDRSVSLFEPRPELNHATNALTMIARRSLSKKLFLDRRSFLNSYDYTVDPDGNYLFGILKAAVPVAGGVNLEYYFSRVDNQRLGAGTKLPHNVMGLIGVANGMDGDLRPGLPSQMIEVHDPIRMFFIVEQFPDVVLSVIQRTSDTYEWFANEWIHLVAVKPDDRSLWYFNNGTFVLYTPLCQRIYALENVPELVESSSSKENLPVHILS